MFDKQYYFPRYSGRYFVYLLHIQDEEGIFNPKYIKYLPLKQQEQ